MDLIMDIGPTSLPVYVCSYIRRRGGQITRPLRDVGGPGATRTGILVGGTKGMGIGGTSAGIQAGLT